MTGLKQENYFVVFEIHSELKETKVSIVWRYPEVRIIYYMGALILRSTERLLIWKNGKAFEYLSESKERHLRIIGHCFGYVRFVESDALNLEIQPIREFREWGSEQSDFCTLIVQPIYNFRSHTFNQCRLFMLKFQWMTEFQYRTFNWSNPFSLRV